MSADLYTRPKVEAGWRLETGASTVQPQCLPGKVETVETVEACPPLFRVTRAHSDDRSLITMGDFSAKTSSASLHCLHCLHSPNNHVENIGGGSVSSLHLFERSLHFTMKPTPYVLAILLASCGDTLTPECDPVAIVVTLDAVDQDVALDRGCPLAIEARTGALVVVYDGHPAPWWETLTPGESTAMVPMDSGHYEVQLPTRTYGGRVEVWP